MNDTIYLSRARLRRHAPAAALRDLLLPSDDGQRAGAGHRLVWTLFADAPERERDFLWREADAGLFYLLSRRMPEDRHGLFELDPPKPFAPTLAVGERLAFALRANATVARKESPEARRGKRADVVMNALHAVPKEERAGERRRAVETAGRAWLESQGARCGFAIACAQGDGGERGEARSHGLRVMGYRTLRVDHSGPAARIGVLDFEGVLEVREPEKFLASLKQGFGRAKAFGCGLMLIRRV